MPEGRLFYTRGLDFDGVHLQVEPRLGGDASPYLKYEFRSEMV
jgi:hypothetical protein